MSCHGVNKFQVVEQPSDFLADVAAEFARRSRDFVDNRGATVEDCYDVFEVTNAWKPPLPLPRNASKRSEGVAAISKKPFSERITNCRLGDWLSVDEQQPMPCRNRSGRRTRAVVFRRPFYFCEGSSAGARYLVPVTPGPSELGLAGPSGRGHLSSSYSLDR
jgi:hypothetical protein